MLSTIYVAVLALLCAWGVWDAMKNRCWVWCGIWAILFLVTGSLVVLDVLAMCGFFDKAAQTG